jgi:hypothetical protein
MRARVVHPLTVRLDSTRIRDDGGLLADALDTALLRAVAQSATTVLDRRAPGYGIEVVLPQARWIVPSSVDVSDEERRAVEQTVQTAIARVMRALQDDGDGDRARLDAGMGWQPAEAVDHSRLSPLGRYVVPSYGGKKREATRVINFTAAEAEDNRTVIGWQFVALAPDEVYAACVEMAKSLPGGPPAAGQVGIVYLGVDGNIWVGALSYPGQAGPSQPDLFHWPVSRLFDVHFFTDTRTPRVVDANSSFRLNWEDTGDKAAEALRRVYGGRLAQQAKQQTPHTDLDGMTDAEYEQAIKETVNTRLAAALKDLVAEGAPAPRALLTLVIDDGPYLLAGDASVNADWIKPGLSLPLNRVSTIEEVSQGQRFSTGRGAGAGVRDRPAKGEGTRPGESGAAAGGAGAAEESGGAAQGVEGGVADGEAGGTVGAAPGQGPRRAIVRTERQSARAGSLFPLAPAGASELTQTCESFEGEPSLDELGAAGAQVRQLLEQIAADLEMQPCEYAGAFLIDTGAFLASRARQVAAATNLSQGRPAAPPKGAKGNLGDLHFIPSASPQIQIMRHLAAVVPNIGRLSEAYRAVLAASPGAIHGVWRNRFISWELRFLAELNNSVAWGVGQLFADTSSVLFGELLRTSAATIQQALTDLPKTASVFQSRILPMLARVDDLITWRDRLRSTMLALAFGEMSLSGIPPASPGEVPLFTPASSGEARSRREQWRAAAGRLAQSLSSASRDRTVGPGGLKVGEVVRTDDGLRIRDDTGRLVGIEELEQRIILLRGSVEEIEPLVKHFDSLPSAVKRMRDGGLDGVTSELRDLLNRMAKHNREITREADADPHYGFTRSAIHEDISHATVTGSKYALGDIHRLAHQEIGEFFRGSGFYPLGINAVFDNELGRRALSGALLFVGLVLISVVCPVAGIVLGGAVALEGLEKAYDKAHVYDALVNPEQVLSKAEVELELFAAWFGAVLAFLPVAGKLVGALAKLGARAAAGRAATGQLARAAAGEGALAAEAGAVGAAEARALIGAAEKDFFEHFVTELVKADVINRVIEAGLTPVLQQLQHDLETAASVGGMRQAISVVMRRRAMGGQ